MDWSITLVSSTGALITGAAALTTFKIRRIADDFLFDWNDSTFKAAGHTTPTVPLVEVSATLFPGLYKKVVSEAAWADGGYQGIVRYAPVGGTAVNGDMLAVIQDGEEISADTALDAHNGAETGISIREALRIILAVQAGKTVIVPGDPGEAEVTFRNVGDSKNRVVADMVGSERTAVTTDGTP